MHAELQMTPWLNLQLCRVFSSLSLTLLPIGPWSLAILLCQQLAAARRWVHPPPRVRCHLRLGDIKVNDKENSTFNPGNYP